jgi:hypothetical protein
MQNHTLQQCVAQSLEISDRLNYLYTRLNDVCGIVAGTYPTSSSIKDGSDLAEPSGMVRQIGVGQANQLIKLSQIFEALAILDQAFGTGKEVNAPKVGQY